MKKNLIFIISFVLIFATMFLALSMAVTAKPATIKENPVPLAGGFDFADDETKTESPRTGDNMLLLIILSGISLTAASIGVTKKWRAG